MGQPRPGPSEVDTMLRAAIDQGVEYSELGPDWWPGGAEGANLGYENAADDWLDLWKNVGVDDYENFLRVGKRWSNSEGETADRLWARIVDRDAWEFGTAHSLN